MRLKLAVCNKHRRFAAAVLLAGGVSVLAGCGSNEVKDPVLLHAEILEQDGVSDDPLIGLVSVSARAPLGTQLLANGNFDDASGPATGWTQKTNRTRFGNLGDIIGPVISGNPAAPTTSSSVARLCGYPYRQVSGSSLTNQNCFDRLNRDITMVPAGTATLTLSADVLGRFSCTGRFNYAQMFLRPLDGGPKAEALSVRISSDSVPASEQGTWRQVTATLNDSEILRAMVGKRYELNILGNTGGCDDPDMSQTYVLFTNISLSATP